jgi:hypothetical protein
MFELNAATAHCVSGDSQQQKSRSNNEGVHDKSAQSPPEPATFREGILFVKQWTTSFSAL